MERSVSVGSDAYCMEHRDHARLPSEGVIGEVKWAAARCVAFVQAPFLYEEVLEGGPPHTK